MDTSLVTSNASAPSPRRHTVRHILLWSVHMVMFALALLLIGLISYDTLHNVAFVSQPRYIAAQGQICTAFIGGVLLEIILMPHRTRRFWISRFLLVLISIPYLNVIMALGIKPGDGWIYVLQYVPMLRAAVAIAVVFGAFSSNFVSSMLLTYIILLLTTVYFGSLIFFVEEHFVNHNIANFSDAVWWVLDELSTVGSPVEPMTMAGQVLGIILSAEGLILFPIFTVYVTDAALRAVTLHNSRRQEATEAPNAAN